MPSRISVARALPLMSRAGMGEYLRVSGAHCRTRPCTLQPHAAKLTELVGIRIIPALARGSTGVLNRNAGGISIRSSARQGREAKLRAGGQDACPGPQAEQDCSAQWPSWERDRDVLRFGRG